MLRYLPTIFTSFLIGAPFCPAQGDILIADFEGADYGDWKATGEAFGPGPARGTLPSQMAVSGFKGSGLVNTFYKGDRTTGTLTSPPFVVERRFLNFLIGGGGHAGKTCIDLLLDGKVVRTATGYNTESGGSEKLVPHSWDVKNLRGKTASIRIVDMATSGWGHVNIDQVVLSAKKPNVPNRHTGPVTKEWTLTKDYILFPIRTGAHKVRVDLRIGGKNVREFDAELARTKEEARFWAFLDVTAFAGKAATLQFRGASEEALALIVQSDEVPALSSSYDEKLRPQLRFSQTIGWNNDPNGMVYYDGEWHLYFQHNPYGWKWGNMHWGHAVSRDLVHWEQLPIAIYNNRRGDWAFSGGAFVDAKNTAGWQTGNESVIVASWTSTGRGECLAYSNDRGRTFTEYAGNPVVKHSGRDPKIVWYAPGKHWVMAVYDQHQKKRSIAFHTSKDLKAWKLQSRLPGYYECPEILELPVDGNPDDTRWVVFAADARYAIGKFDGRTFTPEHTGKHRLHYGNYYASQIFSDSPDGRRIQIGWARINMPGMPFNQTFSFPHRLTLRKTPDGLRMFAKPVKELAKLHREKHSVGEADLAEKNPVGVSVKGELLDIRATFAVGKASAVGLDIGGNRVTYDAKAGKLLDAPLAPVDGKVTLQILVDRPMLEICGNDGRVYITRPRNHMGDVSVVKAFATGGRARLLSLDVYKLESIWKGKRK